MRVLDDANTSLIRPGHEPSVRSAQLIRRWGTVQGIWTWVSTLVMRRS
jgi:hypothetical protein